MDERIRVELEAAAFRVKGKAVPVREVHPIFVSEVLRDVALLREG